MWNNDFPDKIGLWTVLQETKWEVEEEIDEMFKLNQYVPRVEQQKGIQESIEYMKHNLNMWKGQLNELQAEFQMKKWQLFLMKEQHAELVFKNKPVTEGLDVVDEVALQLKKATKDAEWEYLETDTLKHMIDT